MWITEVAMAEDNGTPHFQNLKFLLAEMEAAWKDGDYEDAEHYARCLTREAGNALQCTQSQVATLSLHWSVLGRYTVA